MKHARLLVQLFHSRNPSAPRPSNLRVLSVQHDLKEGILSRTYTSVSDKTQEVRNPPEIIPTGLGK
jgi:hypothetical protein